jgi:UDP-2,3-diacylglucosamine pyrophosphatase LpxH
MFKELIMIIAVSDIHLGYDKSNKERFDSFIDSELTKLSKNDHLVLLGDIFDFWRESYVDVTIRNQIDVSSNAISPTNKEGLILEKLHKLQKQSQVHYIIGNHDYSILYFSKRVDEFPFRVLRNLHL